MPCTYVSSETCQEQALVHILANKEDTQCSVTEVYTVTAAALRKTPTLVQSNANRSVTADDFLPAVLFVIALMLCAD